MTYKARLNPEDFSLLSTSLNEVEKEYVLQQMWMQVSKQSFVISEKDKSKAYLIYPYVYGFADGFLQQFEPCDYFDFRYLMNELALNLMQRQVQHQGEDLVDALTSLDDLDENDPHFLHAINLGGEDGVKSAKNQNYLSTGLYDLFGRTKFTYEQNTENHDFAYELGKKVGGLINKNAKIFSSFAGDTSTQRLEESRLFEKAYEEYEHDVIVKGLWAKAIAEAEGNEKKVEAIYLKLRVQQIKDETELSAKSKQSKSKAAKKKKLEETRKKREEELQKQAEVNYLQQLEKEQRQLEYEKREEEAFDAIPERSLPLLNILIFVVFVGLIFLAAHLLIQYGKNL